MILQAEESFPRGKGNKKRPQTGSLEAKSDNTLSRKYEDDDLFKVIKPVVEKKKKKKSSGLTSEEVNMLVDGGKANVREFAIESLSYESICEGLLSLGRVYKIKEKEMLISLPGRTAGSVPINAISAPYTEALGKIVQRGSFTEDEKEQVYLMEQMFKVGQVVLVKVVNVDRSKKSTRVILSLNPSDVHKNYNATNLVDGMNITCAVKSIEDKGYIMDSGIKGVTAFLPHGAAKSFIRYENDNKQLGIGQLVYCKITKCNIHRLMAKINLTISAKDVAGAVVPDPMCLNYSLLLPGMMVDAAVTNIHKTGMKAYFAEMSGLIHQDHLNEIWSQPMQSDLASSITPRILYIHPNGVSPYLTLKSGLCPYNFFSKNKGQVNKYPIGEKVKVTVTRFEKRGLIVKFPNEEKGIVAIQRCSDDLKLSEEDIGKLFVVGSKHECRILEFSSIDNFYICSLQKSVLDMKFGNVSQVKPGDCVKCKIVKWVPSGAIVNFDKLKGFIPAIHFGDTPILNPSSKFPVDSFVKARVMSHIDGNIKLTAKKKLIKSDGAVLASFDDVKIGMIGDALINRVSKAGLNVFVLGGLGGFVPASKVSKIPFSDLSTAFFVGKVVRYQILEAESKLQRLILTLVLEEGRKEEEDSQIDGDTKSAKGKKPVSKADNGDINKKRKHDDLIEEPSKKKKKKSNKANIKDDSADVVVVDKKSKKKKNKEHTIVDVDEDIVVDIKEEENDSIPNETEKQVIREVKNSKKNKKKRKAKPEIEVENQTVQPPSLELSSQSFWDVSSTINKDEGDSSNDSSGEENTSNNPSKKKKRKKNAEMIRERELRAKELALADPEKVPESVDDFERMVFASPNNSMVWVSYMAFYLQSVEIDKARSVAQRALSRISFGEDKEKTNIWCALLNLEIDHGTKETVKETFDEACRRCDDFLIYKHTVESYLNASKFQEAEQLQNIRLKKFAKNVEVWKSQADILCKYLKKSNESSKLLERCLQHLNKKDYVDLANHIARLEMKHGNVERGKTMFETTLQSFPKRSDIWIMYAKILISINDIDAARNVYCRAIETSLLKKKPMQTIFKDALQFEDEHGNDKTKKQMESFVKEKCLAYGSSLSTLIS